MVQQDTEYICPVSTTLHCIGGKYKALILWHLMGGPLRFNQLRRLMPQATSKMLTQQLRELEQDALLTRTVYPVVPPRVDYALSDRGRSLGPLLDDMYLWGSIQLNNAGIEPNCTMTACVERQYNCGCGHMQKMDD